MFQTVGPNGDFELNKMILSDIARLRKMPDLAHRIEQYQPQPDQLQQQKAQLEILLLQKQIEEIDSRTMESKLVPHLFLAGEILDLDACTRHNRAVLIRHRALKRAGGDLRLRAHIGRDTQRDEQKESTPFKRS